MHSLHLSYSASSFSSCLRRCPTCLSIEGSLTWVFYIYIYIFSKSLRGWRLHRGVAGVLVSKITNQRPQFSRLLEHVVQKLLQSNLRLGHGNGYLGQVGPKKTEDPKKSEDIKLLFIIFYYHVIFLTLEAVFPPPGRPGLLLLWRLWSLHRWSCIGSLPLIQVFQLLESIGVNLGGIGCLKGQGQLHKIYIERSR